MFKEKFYNRETIAASNYKIQQISFSPLLCSSNNQPFSWFNDLSQFKANHDKVDWLSANSEIPLKGIVSLF